VFGEGGGEGGREGGDGGREAGVVDGGVGDDGEGWGGPECHYFEGEEWRDEGIGLEDEECVGHDGGEIEDAGLEQAVGGGREGGGKGGGEIAMEDKGEGKERVRMYVHRVN